MPLVLNWSRGFTGDSTLFTKALGVSTVVSVGLCDMKLSFCDSNTYFLFLVGLKMLARIAGFKF